MADKVHPWLIVEGKFRSPFDKLQPNCAVETNQEKNKYHLIMEQAHFPPDGQFQYSIQALRTLRFGTEYSVHETPRINIQHFIHFE